MIEINLIEVKKPLQMPIVMGLDLNYINIKGMLLALMILYLPQPLYFNSKFETELSGNQKVVDDLQKNLRDLKKQSRGSKEIQAKIEEFKAQEKRLESRLSAAKEVIKLKKNPMKLLHYISQNIPKDAWIDEIKLERMSDNKDVVRIKGGSESYPSIGIFLENLRNSVFYNPGDPRLADTRTGIDTKLGINVNYFEFVGTIKSYE